MNRKKLYTAIESGTLVERRNFRFSRQVLRLDGATHESKCCDGWAAGCVVVVDQRGRGASGWFAAE
jgi:hypothetical protein